MSKLNFIKWFKEFLFIHKINKSLTEKIVFLPFDKYSTFQYNEEKFYVFEDWWLKNPEIVKSKISTMFGKNERIFGRKCSIQKIDKINAGNFLNENHIYGATASKHQIGLLYKSNLHAIATFAAPRNFPILKSGEMLRFCSKKNTTIVGGLSKLVKFYFKTYKLDNIMTYIDLDWSNGSSFKNIGFKSHTKRDGIIFYCNRLTGDRIPEKYFDDFKNIDNYVKIVNSGSIKKIISKW